MLKKMNLPNKLTMLRMLLVIVFVVFMCLPTKFVWAKYVSLGAFVVASITDFLDGYISRKKNLVTKFGKIMDPLADKMLVASGFILLATAGVIPAWMAVIIVLRDFFVTGLRNFGADNNKDLAASLTGKVKTVFQLLAIILALVGTYNFGDFVTQSLVMTPIELLINIGMSVSVAAAVLATVWSLIDYIARFKDSVKVDE
ncbi:cDP-diacylglycerol-glycerol-3-phosphate 3-phosphatidyltransferase [Clostridium sp. CAG:465]|jgi:CDP-diacylglycerol--glycerol-3-phosphate 3-phosphatidyltransferase|nr:cDP-diacylglycerol-glycerol-3-phosphate 3-phosphatidyltransferase [Clostridium sp. CAG:465]